MTTTWRGSDEKRHPSRRRPRHQNFINGQRRGDTQISAAVDEPTLKGNTVTALFSDIPDERPKLSLVDSLTLFDVIRDVLDSNLDVRENQALADLVFAATPAESMSGFYRQALTYVIPVVNANTRNAKPVGEPLQETPRSGKGRGPGWKQRNAAQHWYEQKLNARLGIAGKNVPFRFVTIDELELYAADVISGGQAQITNGRKYELLAKIGRERGYSTGEDFPEDVLREVLG